LTKKMLRRKDKKTAKRCGFLRTDWQERCT